MKRQTGPQDASTLNEQLEIRGGGGGGGGGTVTQGPAGVDPWLVELDASQVPLAITSTVLGTTTDAKVITDATGTIHQYLRGLIYLLITAGQTLLSVTRKFAYQGINTLTTTNFSSLVSGSGWQSDSIATLGCCEIQFTLNTLGAAGSTAFVDFYLAEAFTSGNFSDGATGTEGTFTAADRKNSRFIGSLLLNTTTAVNGVIRVTDVAGTMLERVALIAINNSGGTISATAGNTVFKYQLVY